MSDTPTVSPVFDHYPYFMFAVLPDGSKDFWIASCYDLDPEHPETIGSKLTREHMNVCRSYWRRQRRIDVDVVVLPKSEVNFSRRR